MERSFLKQSLQTKIIELEENHNLTPDQLKDIKQIVNSAYLEGSIDGKKEANIISKAIRRN